MLLSYHGPEATPVWWKLSRNSKQDEINNRRIRILAVITATKQSKPWMKSNLANVGECIHQGDTQCKQWKAMLVLFQAEPLSQILQSKL